MADYDLSEDELQYSIEAIQALSLHNESERLNNNYKLHESYALHLTLLDHEDLPALWRSILNMSLATLNPADWKTYLEQAVCAWKETGRGPGDPLWEDMGIMMRKLVKAIESLREQKDEEVLGQSSSIVVGGGVESARSSESESDTSLRRGSEDYNARAELDVVEGETDADIIALAFEILKI